MLPSKNFFELSSSIVYNFQEELIVPGKTAYSNLSESVIVWLS